MKWEEKILFYLSFSLLGSKLFASLTLSGQTLVCQDAPHLLYISLWISVRYFRAVSVLVCVCLSVCLFVYLSIWTSECLRICDHAKGKSHWPSTLFVWSNCIHWCFPLTVSLRVSVQLSHLVWARSERLANCSIALHLSLIRRHWPYKFSLHHSHSAILLG